MKLSWFLASLALVTTQAHACPVLNGTFESKDGSATRTLQLYTSQDDGQLRYRLGAEGTWLPADGRVRAVQTEHVSGLVRVTCDGSSVTIASRPEGASPVTIHVQMLDTKRVRVRSDAVAAEGVYVRVRD